MVIYFVFALFVARWARGVLPMIAGLAIILGIFGIVAAPAWFDRDKDGFTDPALSAMIAFRQHWNVEAERPREQRDPEPEPAPA